MEDKPWIEVIHDIDELSQKYWDEIIWVLWWAKTFEALLPYIDEIYITLIPWKHEWDAFMPKFPDGHIEDIGGTKSWLKFQRYHREKSSNNSTTI